MRKNLLRPTYSFLSIALAFGFAAGYFFERPYHTFIRLVFEMNYGNRIDFIGRIPRYQFQHSLAFILITTLFCSLFYLLTRFADDKAMKTRSTISAILFFALTIATSAFDAFRYVAECTACGDQGPVRVDVQHIAYNKHLLFSLVIILSYLSICYLKDRKNKEHKLT